jgi:hypothetical protein
VCPETTETAVDSLLAAFDACVNELSEPGER